MSKKVRKQEDPCVMMGQKPWSTVIMLDPFKCEEARRQKKYEEMSSKSEEEIKKVYELDCIGDIVLLVLSLIGLLTIAYCILGLYSSGFSDKLMSLELLEKGVLLLPFALFEVNLSFLFVFSIKRVMRLSGYKEDIYFRGNPPLKKVASITLAICCTLLFLSFSALLIMLLI